MRLAQTERTNIRNRTTVTLEREDESVTLTVYALPPTYADEAEEELPSPQPRKLGVSRDKKGRLDKDEMGRPVYDYDEDDEQYKRDLRAVKELQSIKMIVDALDPEEVSFEAKKDANPRLYYEAVRREMTSFGFSIGDIVAIVKAVGRVSGIDDEAMKAARTDFFEEES